MTQSAPPHPRRPYAPPTLRRHGSVEELTQRKMGSASDSAGSSRQVTQ